jgi:hypothetical protein
MEPDDLLDQQANPKEVYNKNPLLYAFVSLCLLGFLMQRLHWPGYSLFMVFGGGLSVGYIMALLMFFKQHYFFENAGFFIYVSFITFSIIDIFVPTGWYLYFGSAGLAFTAFFLFLRGKEIV